MLHDTTKIIRYTSKVAEIHSEYYKKYSNTSVIVYGDRGRLLRTGTTRRDKNTGKQNGKKPKSKKHTKAKKKY